MTERLGVMRVLDLLSGILLVLGGLWLGLAGLFGLETVLGSVVGSDLLVRFLYILIGIAAVYDVVMIRAIPRRWHCTMITGSPGEVTT